MEVPVGTMAGLTSHAALDVSSLWRVHYAGMVRLAYLLTGSQGYAEDLVQDAFVSLQRCRRPIDDPVGYLRVCVVNRCRRWRGREAMARSRQPRPALSNEQLDVDGVSEMVGKLPRKQRVAIVLRFYEDLSFAQIAAVMGCPTSTARSHVHRGLAQLREVIEP